jgi:hypothetical protein
VVVPVMLYRLVASVETIVSFSVCVDWSGMKTFLV